MTDLNKFSKEIDEVARVLREVVFNEKIVQEKAHIPPKLFHYTSAAGLIGILESQEIWLRPDDLQRDHLELEYGGLLLDSVRREANPLADLRDTHINPFAGSRLERQLDGVYVASFCSNGDVPHHWQNFADGGRGFSIGINFPDRIQGWAADAKGISRPFLRPVLYDERRQRHLLHELLARAADHGANELRSPAQYALRQVMGEVLPSLKHPSFGNEDEWRMFVSRSAGQPPPGAKVTTVQGTIRAYLAARFREGILPIDCIISGPKVPPASRAALERLAMDKELDESVILRSKWAPDRISHPV